MSALYGSYPAKGGKTFAVSIARHCPPFAGRPPFGPWFFAQAPPPFPPRSGFVFFTRLDFGVFVFVAVGKNTPRKAGRLRI